MRFLSFCYSLVMAVVVSVLAGLLVAGLAIPLVGASASTAKAARTAMARVPAELETPPQAERSRVLMANGEVLATFWDENRVYVPLGRISPVMRMAQVAIEDHRFFEHGALDTRGTLRALVRNGSGGEATQGGSSLTQQYVKMVLIQQASESGDDAGVARAQEKSVSRKIQELRYAVALEKRLNKEQILERYLNLAYYGDGSYGVEAAARHYFDVGAKDLDLAQSAMLAGLVQNPVATDPVHQPTIARDRRDVVLGRIGQLGLATPTDLDAARRTPFDRSRVQRQTNGCQGTRYPFLCDYVKRSLQRLPALGNTPAERLETLKRGGLTIETEIDPATQDAAERAIANTVDARDPVISTMTMIKPGSGLILAMAQNRRTMGDDAAAGQTYYNYAVGGAASGEDLGGAEGYQAGSTFKVFTAAAALEQGRSFAQTYDAPEQMSFGGQTFRDCTGRFKLHGNWQVGNSTGVNGTMDLVRATAWSVNTYYIQLIRDTGGCASTRMAQKAGIKLGSRGDLVQQFAGLPSFVLGSAEVTPLSVAEAYATFAARGRHCDPIILERVTDRTGRPIPVPDANCKQVMDQRVADAMNDLLSQVMDGTGRPATIPGGFPQAGKTGTIDDNQAVWFAGYTPVVAGAGMIAIDKTHPWWKSKEYAQFGWSIPRLKQVRLPVSRYWMEGSGGGDVGKDVYAPAMAAYLKGRPRTPFVRSSAGPVTPTADASSRQTPSVTRSARPSPVAPPSPSPSRRP
ncbi:penicillin-binding protein [Naumannella sp. ID2617S]|nr:penicillin-binding protein [Naumannella sp. ID2617S]